MYKKKQQRRPRRPKRGFLFKRRTCRLCTDKVKAVDYKDVALLQKFITERGKIIPPRVSRACARHQKMITRAIERARSIALLQFVRK